uniref:YlcI/YnfO family protein n=1 Tax=Xanthobacter autotrophicus (strain ATCC BAA-1158 / Py2) TaxID=78245 RepID=UPI003735F807
MISDTQADMTGRGRPRTNFEQTPARLAEGTLERMDALLWEGESRADFLRAAVEREIRARVRARSAKSKPKGVAEE